MYFFIFKWGVKNTTSSLSIRALLLLFFEEATKKGILTSIVPVPAITSVCPEALFFLLTRSTVPEDKIATSVPLASSAASFDIIETPAATIANPPVSKTHAVVSCFLD
ncbi:MAG TPA: hypothetical protein VF622_12930 [Segetibacter sp.]